MKVQSTQELTGHVLECTTCSISLNTLCCSIKCAVTPISIFNPLTMILLEYSSSFPLIITKLIAVLKNNMKNSSEKEEWRISSS